MWDSKKVMVVGGGSMGNGIVQVCAQKGLQVVLYDLTEEQLVLAERKIRWSVTKFIEKGKLDQDLDAVMARIQFDTTFETAATVNMVIEAVFEKIEVKQEVLGKIEPLLPEGAIIASNTSAIPISEIASALQRPERFLGIHFFNPVPMMKAVEVIRGIATSEENFQAGAEFVRFLGKEPIMVNRDLAGFILNRINMCANIEAMRLVEQGVATPADIDKGMRLAFGRKMGPFETTDLVGLDVQLMAYTNVYEEEKDPRFYPPSILRRKVVAGQLGIKAGRGWYSYDSQGKREE